LTSEGGIKWILEGDANTGYFHSTANGRRRKCRIEFLDTDLGRITEQKELVMRIESFYKNMFGRENRGRARLAKSTWQVSGRLPADQQEGLIRPFSMEEV
jgi:hypothetical protein